MEVQDIAEGIKEEQASFEILNDMVKIILKKKNFLDRL